MNLSLTEHSVLSGIERSPHDPQEALAVLTTLSDRLWAKRDLRAVFPDVYGVITRNVGAALARADAPVFIEPLWLARLAGRFCELYVKWLSASLGRRKVQSVAWSVAFSHSRRFQGYPVQDAILGINAHINFDLAQGIRDNIVAFGTADDDASIARYKHDHDAVNEILEASMPEILDRLVKRYACPISARSTRTPELTAKTIATTMRTLERWRERVWDEMLLLLRARDAHEGTRTLARMNRRSGAWGAAVYAGTFTADRTRWLRPTLKQLLAGTRRVFLSNGAAA
jgi:hypothetical protein